MPGPGVNLSAGYGLCRGIDKEGGGSIEILPHDRCGWLFYPYLFNGSAHMREPGVAFRLSDMEADMPHPQPWMASLVAVILRAAKELS